MYEIAWIRKATLIFGSTTAAMATIVATFLLGLAIGSALFGRIAGRVRAPLRLYAILELCIAVLAVFSLGELSIVRGIYGAAYRTFEGPAAALVFVRILLVALVILPPTILMGGTLPLFAHRFVSSDGHIARTVGMLYAANTLGAAAGCVIAGFVLVPQLGLRWTVAAAALVSAACGGIVAALRMPPSPPPRRAQRSAADERTHRVVAMLFFGVGFVALSAEIIWARYLALVVRNTVYTYTLALAVVLLGIVIGSVLAGRLVDRSTRRAFLFGALQIATGLTIMGIAMLPPATWQALGSRLWVYAVALLVPSILSGASFPLAVRMVVRTADDAAAGTGRMAAANTFGAIAGSIFAGFVGLPALGIDVSLRLTTGLALAIGILAWLLLVPGMSFVRRIAIAGIAVIVWISIPRFTATQLPGDFLAANDVLVDYEEGAVSNLAVVRSDDGLTLEIDGLWQGTSRKNHQAMAMHIPLLLHGGARRVLVVGLGSGQSAGRALMHDIERLDCVDIDPSIFAFVRKHFDSGWMDDERVHLVAEDGLNYIHHTDATYDVISLEAGQIFRPGVAFFYTTDFYRRARERLNPGGVLTQFVPVAFFL